MARNRFALGWLAVLAVGGCSGGAATDAVAAAEAALMPPVIPAKQMGAGVAAAGPATDDPATAGDSLQRAREIEVMRETFAYGGGTRDPFNSLITGISSGPELTDLQLVGVYENLQTPSRSVVVLREKATGKRHKMQAGDRLARLRLVQIRPREAVFMIQDLGFERQETLSLRKQEEATP